MHNQKHRLRHTEVPCGSRLRWPLRESTSKPMAVTPGRSMQREIATPLLFKSERPSNRGYVGVLWSVIFQVRETKQRKEAERQQREGGHSCHGTTPMFGAPVSRDGQRPPHLAGIGSPSSGKAAFLYPHSQKMAWHTPSNHAGVTCPPCLPDGRQEQQTASPGTPLRPRITVSRATFQKAKSADREKIRF